MPIKAVGSSVTARHSTVQINKPGATMSPVLQSPSGGAALQSAQSG